MSVARDVQLAIRARRHGARYSLRIVREARRAGIPISLGFALVEQESAFRNVFGSDPTIFAGAGKVTQRKYQEYRRRRGASGGGGMQGVGPVQLTWYSYQDAADKLGGCWIPRHNIRVGFSVLAGHVKAKGGLTPGIAAYNGSGPAAQRYSSEVRRKMVQWHGKLR